MNYQNRQWFDISQPEGRVGAEHYALRDSDALAANEVLVRARYISVDPYMRIYGRPGDRLARDVCRRVQAIAGSAQQPVRGQNLGKLLVRV